MSNGQEQCCAAGICCPPNSEQRIAALAKVIADNVSHDQTIPTWLNAARCVLEHFDLAPKGTLQPFIDAVATMARAHK